MELSEALERHRPRGGAAPAPAPARTGEWRLQLLGTWVLDCDGAVVPAQVPAAVQPDRAIR